jgi:hypothetical protein
MCNECADVQKSENKNDQRKNTVGVACPADVSPNTPVADEVILCPIVIIALFIC